MINAIILKSAKFLPHNLYALGSNNIKVQYKLDESTETPITQVTPVPKSILCLSAHIVVVFHIRASHRLPSFSFHDNRASHSRDTIWPWKFNVKGQCQKHPSQRSIQLTHFLFVWPTIPKIWQIDFSTWEKQTWNCMKKIATNVTDRIHTKFDNVGSMTRGIYLPRFEAIGWAVLALSWEQVNFCLASGA